LTDSAAKAKKYALTLLGYRSRSEKELEERLRKKGFTGDQISFTLESLKKNGYLDDYSLALDLKRQATENKLLGYNRTRKFLLDRGVPDEIVNSALTYNEDAEIRKIQKLVEKKLRGMGRCPDPKNKKRLWDFLARKGYSFSVIQDALRNLTGIEEEE
jgi:regulatory protein